MHGSSYLSIVDDIDNLVLNDIRQFHRAMDAVVAYGTDHLRFRRPGGAPFDGVAQSQGRRWFSVAAVASQASQQVLEV